MLLLIAMLIQPPSNPPFDFDVATANQLRGEWGRSDIDASGLMIGTVQRERRILGIVIEDVYPFGSADNPNPKSFRRVNTVSQIMKNRKLCDDIMGGLVKWAPIPEAAKRLPVAPPPRPGRVITHEGDPDTEEFVPQFRFPPGVFVPEV